MNVSLLCQLCDLLWWLLIGIIGFWLFLIVYIRVLIGYISVLIVYVRVLIVYIRVLIGYIVVLIDFGLCETDDGLVIEWCKVKNIIDLLFEVFDFLLYLMERLCHRL